MILSFYEISDDIKFDSLTYYQYAFKHMKTIIAPQRLHQETIVRGNNLETFLVVATRRYP